MNNRKLILVVGIPATGKTTVGNFLRDKFNYKHINFEDGVSLNRFAQNPTTYITTELNQGDIVITWGFVPVDEQIRVVKYLENYGFKLIWFDGDRLAAFREYLKEGREEKAFYFQMYRIEDSNVISAIKPTIINTFKDSKFKAVEEIVREIESDL